MRLRWHENVRFCPHCGVGSLERDFHKQCPPRPGGGGDKGVRQTSNGTEWICRTCGFGFKIGKSSRVADAEFLISRDRSLRNSVQFNTECVGQEVAAEYVRTKDDHL